MCVLILNRPNYNLGLVLREDQVNILGFYLWSRLGGGEAERESNPLFADTCMHHQQTTYK